MGNNSHITDMILTEVLGVVRQVEELIYKPHPRPTVHEIAKGLLEASIADHSWPSMEMDKVCDWAYDAAQQLYDRGTQWEKEQGGTNDQG